ncbi:flavin reductase [Nereida sp. MMG025]|uniref:flavin reductase family protein n=1 Tax=Nereida sp. MMG025 TaxID=2909981 RepID=UPI00351CF23E|nr:flavin reductase family protein [Nereida sp. MMG025]
MTGFTSISPQDDARGFRDALGQYGTGVCVITTRTSENQIVGMTANSFASVSLDPPLVLWSPAKSSRRFEAFSEAPHYAIHVLGTAHTHVAADFVREANAFSGLSFGVNAHGVPLLEDCIARFECDTDVIHDAGDHAIIVGRVTNVAMGAGAPLMFQGGRYGDFAAH